MGRFKRDYSLYLRPTKTGRRVYYCRFRGTDDRYLTAVSTGCTDRRRAEAWANKQLRDDAVVIRRSLTFATFAEDWWTTDSKYVRSRQARGFSLSPGYLAVMRTNLERHVLPEFAERRLSSVTPTDVEAWRLRLFDDGLLAPRTINLATRVLSTMLAEANRLGYIARNPSAGLGKLAEHPRSLSGFARRHSRVFECGRATGPRLWPA